MARRTVAVAVAVTLLTSGSTGAALAAGQGSQAGQETRALLAPCDALAERIARLQATKAQLAAAITAVQQRMASGTLRRGQLRAAQALLAALQDRLARIDTRLTTLQARYDTGCTTGGGQEPPPLPPPGE